MVIFYKFSFTNLFSFIILLLSKNDFMNIIQVNIHGAHKSPIRLLSLNTTAPCVAVIQFSKL